MQRNNTQLSELFDCEFIDKALKIYGFSRINAYPDLSQKLKFYQSKLTKTKSKLLSIPSSFIYQSMGLNRNPLMNPTWILP